MGLISLAVENNRREIKRFLNNFIITHEIFSSKNNYNTNELTIIQAIQLRWNLFYHFLLSSDRNTICELEPCVKYDDRKRSSILSSDLKDQQNHSATLKQILNKYKHEFEFWNYLSEYFEVLVRVEDLTVYRRATRANMMPLVSFGEEDDVLTLLTNG